jgi:hypothetical protein
MQISLRHVAGKFVRRVVGLRLFDNRPPAKVQLIGLRRRGQAGKGGLAVDD